MDPFSILTYFAFLAAALSLVPHKFWHLIFLRISTFTKIIFSCLLILIFYLSFLPVFSHFDLVFEHEWQWGFDRELTLLLATVILTSVALYIMWPTGRIPSRNIKKLPSIIEELIRRKDFESLSFLMQKLTNQLVSSTQKIHPWGDLYTGKNYIFSRLKDKSKSTLGQRLINIGLIKKIFLKLPKEPVPTQHAKKSLTNFKRSKSASQSLASMYPETALHLSFSHGDANENERFLEFFFETVLNSKDSPLKNEVRDIYETSVGVLYIEKSSVILNTLFKDISNYNQLSVWRPLGTVLSLIITDLNKIGNLHNPKISQGEIYSEQPIHMGLACFQVAVSEGIKRSGMGHLFLYYTSYLIQDICNELKNDSETHVDHEFPRVYDFWIYSILDVTLDWVTLSFKTYKEETALLLEEDDTAHHTGLNLASCLFQLIRAKNISPNQLKKYLEMTINCFNSGKTSSVHGFINRQVVHALKQNIKYLPSYSSYGCTQEEFLNRLKLSLSKVDHVARDKDSIFENILKEYEP